MYQSYVYLAKNSPSFFLEEDSNWRDWSYVKISKNNYREIYSFFSLYLQHVITKYILSWYFIIILFFIILYHVLRNFYFDGNTRTVIRHCSNCRSFELRRGSVPPTCAHMIVRGRRTQSPRGEGERARRGEEKGGRRRGCCRWCRQTVQRALCTET